MAYLVKIVEELIIKPLAPHEIIYYLKTHHDMSERCAREYITKVYDKWRSEPRGEIQDTRNSQINRLIRLHRETSDYATKIKAEQLIAKLAGTEAPQKVESTVEDISKKSEKEIIENGKRALELLSKLSDKEEEDDDE